MPPPPPPRVLTIAGSDPSGGAGVEADVKVMTAHGCYAMTCITALTAQNTLGVADVHHVPPAFVAKALHAVLSDIGVDVVKTGMLASAETVEVVARALEREEEDEGRKLKVVLDPVVVSTSGAQLLPEPAVATLVRRLLPRTFLLTPNAPEALLLLSTARSETPWEIGSLADLVDVAKRIQLLGPEAVLLKGGHVPLTAANTAAGKDGENAEKVVDVFCDGNTVELIETRWIDSKATHGTGCSLASAIASNLAKGLTTLDAVRRGCQYVAAAIRTAPSLGHGSGPINHLHSTYSLPFAPGHFVPYLLSHPRIAPAWRAYTHHPFVTSLGAGTLPLRSFKYYLVQDYLFLTQFARANALAAYKSTDMDAIAKAARIVLHVHRELDLHTGYCATLDIPRSVLGNTPESLACTAYTRYVLDVGNSGDFVALQVAMAPCLLGYGEIARRLFEEGQRGEGEGEGERKGGAKRTGNPYWSWIENYVAADYVEAVAAGRELLEEKVQDASPARIEQLVDIFEKATRLETGFWEMGWGGGELVA